MKLRAPEGRPPREDETVEIDAIALNDKCLDIGIGRAASFLLLSDLLLRRVRKRSRHEAQAGQVCLRGLIPFAGFVAPFNRGFVAVPGARLLKLGLLAQHVFGPRIPRLLASPPQRNALVLVHACLRQSIRTQIVRALRHARQWQNRGRPSPAAPKSTRELALTVMPREGP